MGYEFFLDIIPPTRTEQQHRVFVSNGHPVFYRDKRLREAREKIDTALEPYKPEEPLDCPVYVKIIWCFPYKKQVRKKDIGKAVPKDTRPDIDNINKNLLDSLNGRFIKDDAQITRLTIEKCWYKTPGIFIKILPLDREIFSNKVIRAVEGAEDVQ